MVRAKKHLGQHFLHDQAICSRIADSLIFSDKFPQQVLEIGPGTGALTTFLLQKPADLQVMEIDTESISYLQQHFPALKDRILYEDFLQADLHALFVNGKFNLIGNFPYHISTQIMFRVFENRDVIPQVVGMFQKEVAMRIASGHGNKDYGILSVLLQAYYKIEYLFSVDENAFTPPPKVKSGVIRLIRNDREKLPVSDARFKLVVKAAFNQRRKMLRNSLAGVIENIEKHPYATRRPEQMSVDEFIELASIT